MAVTTFWDIRRFRRCPYEYQLDRRSGTVATTLEECLDLSVRDALLMADQKRMMHGKVTKDEVLSAFWDAWDRHFPSVHPQDQETARTIRFGERCVANYISALSRRQPGEMIAAGLGGSVTLPDGSEIMVSVDLVYGSGKTLTVCRYMCEPGVRSSEELARDYEMRVGALWALRNLRGYDRVRLRWEFLGTGVTSECSVTMDQLKQAAVDTALVLADMRPKPDVLPRESDHCQECRHMGRCPRFTHELAVKETLFSVSEDEGVRMADRYAELQEKIDALRERQRMLEAQQKELAREMVEFADAHGYMSLRGTGCKVLVRHERKVELPEDKSAIIARLKETGQYDGLSMVNYPRLRSDIAKGEADPLIMRMATVTDVTKVYVRRAVDRGKK